MSKASSVVLRFPTVFIMFGRKMVIGEDARIVRSALISTSSNLRHHMTVSWATVYNWAYRTTASRGVALVPTRDGLDGLSWLVTHHCTGQARCTVSELISLWRPLLPYGYSYKASYARLGWVIICSFWHPGNLWRSGLSVRVTGCQKFQMTGGLHRSTETIVMYRSNL